MGSSEVAQGVSCPTTAAIVCDRRRGGSARGQHAVPTATTPGTRVGSEPSEIGYLPVRNRPPLPSGCERSSDWGSRWPRRERVDRRGQVEGLRRLGDSDLTLNIVQYYPRALTGDGGVTGQIRRMSHSLRAFGAETKIICDIGPEPTPTGDGICWARILHRRIAGRTSPHTHGLAIALRVADVMFLNSAWTVQNVAAASVARSAGVPYIVAPRGAYDAHVRQRHRLVKDASWLRARAPHAHSAEVIASAVANLRRLTESS